LSHAACVDHHVIKLGCLLLDLCPHHLAVRVGRAGNAGRIASLGTQADRHLRRALAVAVEEPHITPGQCAGDGEVDRDGCFADAALRLPTVMII
jgi:hypothetical protein